MSLYYEAATFLAAQLGTDASLTARIYGAKALKSKPAQVFALVSESTKWSSVLSGIIDTAGILRLERKVCVCWCCLEVESAHMAHSSRRSSPWSLPTTSFSPEEVLLPQRITYSSSPFLDTRLD